MTETVQPFTSEGFVLDARRQRVFDRRMEVLKYVLDGYTPTVIAQHTDMKRQRIRDDVIWLKKHAYIDANFKFRYKLAPTRETVTLICQWLRQGRTYAEIGEELNFSGNTINNYVVNSKDPKVQAARKYKASLRTKKAKTPLVGVINTESFKEFFGLHPETWSNCNLWVTWKDTPEDERPGSVRKRMYKLNFTELPKAYTDYWEKVNGVCL